MGRGTWQVLVREFACGAGVDKVDKNSGFLDSRVCSHKRFLTYAPHVSRSLKSNFPHEVRKI